MMKEELTSHLSEKFESTAVDAAGQFLNLSIEPASWPDVMQYLRFDDALRFDFMFCLTCVDWQTHLTMVYHLRSTTRLHEMVVKAKLDRNTPQIASCCNLWRTAEFHEREVCELFGVEFINHPDLRKLILPDDWEGFPMRKDYEDPVNMIKL